jgi:hypothetical protein
MAGKGCPEQELDHLSDPDQADVQVSPQPLPESETVTFAQDRDQTSGPKMVIQFQPFHGQEQLPGFKVPLGEDLMPVIPFALIELDHAMVLHFLTKRRPGVGSDVHGVQIGPIIINEVPHGRAKGSPRFLLKTDDVPEDGKDTVLLQQLTGQEIIAGC